MRRQSAAALCNGTESSGFLLDTRTRTDPTNMAKGATQTQTQAATCRAVSGTLWELAPPHAVGNSAEKCWVSSAEPPPLPLPAAGGRPPNAPTHKQHGSTAPRRQCARYTQPDPHHNALPQGPPSFMGDRGEEETPAL